MSAISDFRFNFDNHNRPSGPPRKYQPDMHGTRSIPVEKLAGCGYSADSSNEFFYRKEKIHELKNRVVLPNLQFRNGISGIYVYDPITPERLAVDPGNVLARMYGISHDEDLNRERLISRKKYTIQHNKRNKRKAMKNIGEILSESIIADEKKLYKHY